MDETLPGVDWSITKIMSWDFTRELSCRNRQRDSYAKWKANEEAARQRAKELQRGKM